MKSIKPGRGPSFMAGIIAVLAGVFGVFWMVFAIKMGAGPFALFGVIFIVIAVVQAVYNFKNAIGKNRYSSFDIMENDEEPDPLNEKYGEKTVNKFCPYCGTKVDKNHKFCNNCGKKLD